MFTFLFIMSIGLLSGRIFLHFTKRQATIAEQLLGYVVWAMLAAFGIRIGSDSGIMERLPLLGFQALVLGVSVTLTSGLATSLVFRRFAPSDHTLTDPSNTKFSGRALRGTALALTFFTAGLATGRLSLLPINTDTAAYSATLLLQILIALVGISTGSNPRLMSILRGLRPIIVAVPAIAIVATIVTGAIVGLGLSLGAADSSLAVSGMGYYSLASMIISDLRAADMGAPAAMSLATVALMANIVREICALILIPLVGPRMGIYGSTAMCGVTSIDIALPSLVATFGAEVIPVALVNGIILEVATPFTVMASCSIASAMISI